MRDADTSDNPQPVNSLGEVEDPSMIPPSPDFDEATKAEDQTPADLGLVK